MAENPNQESINLDILINSPSYRKFLAKTIGDCIGFHSYLPEHHIKKASKYFTQEEPKHRAKVEKLLSFLTVRYHNPQEFEDNYELAVKLKNAVKKAATENIISFVRNIEFSIQKLYDDHPPSNLAFQSQRNHLIKSNNNSSPEHLNKDKVGFINEDFTKFKLAKDEEPIKLSNHLARAYKYFIKKLQSNDFEGDPDNFTARQAKKILESIDEDEDITDIHYKAGSFTDYFYTNPKKFRPVFRKIFPNKGGQNYGINKNCLP